MMEGTGQPQGSDHAIQINGLQVRFGDDPVLRDLTLGFRPRALSVIIGRSGSGKTTLLRSMNGSMSVSPNARPPVLSDCEWTTDSLTCTLTAYLSRN